MQKIGLATIGVMASQLLAGALADEDVIIDIFGSQREVRRQNGKTYREHRLDACADLARDLALSVERSVSAHAQEANT